MQNLLLVIVAFILIDCSNSNTNILNKNVKNNVIEIDTLSVLFFAPNEIEVEEIKKNIGENYYTILDDNNYYNSIAIDFFKDKKIKIISTNVSLFKFVKSNGNIVYVKKTSFQHKWGTILFDCNQNPKEIDIMNVETEYKRYFGR